jgi:hypothetical protein
VLLSGSSTSGLADMGLGLGFGDFGGISAIISSAKHFTENFI